MPAAFGDAVGVGVWVVLDADLVGVGPWLDVSWLLQPAITMAVSSIATAAKGVLRDCQRRITKAGIYEG